MSTLADFASTALRAWRERGSLIELNGHRLFLRADGDVLSPPLLLLHGFPTSSWDWAPLWPELVSHFRVFAPDLLGYGFSDKPRAHRYRIVEQADLICALLAKHGISAVHILAHDYGDSVAQELLARSRQNGPLILSTVLLNGGVFAETQNPRLIQRLLAGTLGPLIARLLTRARFERSFAAVFGAHTQPSAAELADYWAVVSHDDGHRIAHRLLAYLAERHEHRDRWVHAMQRAGVPLRFIDGLADPVSGAAMVARYRKLIPNADVVELPDIGHYPQVEAPTRVLDACMTFWRRVRAFA
jgi:pimeloyl-ACP methyl ester carboxylesterase